MAHVVENKISIQYDGTNGDYICGEWSNNGLAKMSDNGQTLELETATHNGYTATLQVGDWVVAAPPWWLSGLTNSAYIASYYELPES